MSNRLVLFVALLSISVTLWSGIDARSWHSAGQPILPDSGGDPGRAFLPLLLRSAEPASAPRTITHSQSQAIAAGNSIACHVSFRHTDNAYLREFALTDFGITGAFQVQQVEFGVERAVAGSGASQPGQVRLYRKIDPNSPLTYANLTLLAAVDIAIPDMALGRYNAPIAGTAPAGSVLVVEVFTPDGRPDGHSFYIGSNAQGQSGATYIAAVVCGAPEPTTSAVLGYPNMHAVMNVTGIVTGAAAGSVSQGTPAAQTQIRLSSESGSSSARFSTYGDRPYPN